MEDLEQLLQMLQTGGGRRLSDSQPAPRQEIPSKTYQYSQDHGLRQAQGDLRNNLVLMMQALRTPDKKMDLYEIYRWLQRQNMDEQLNNTLAGRAIGQDQLRQRENNYLLDVPKNLPEGYARDSSGGFSAYPKLRGNVRGKWM